MYKGVKYKTINISIPFTSKVKRFCGAMDSSITEKPGVLSVGKLHIKDVCSDHAAGDQRWIDGYGLG